MALGRTCQGGGCISGWEGVERSACRPFPLLPKFDSLHLTPFYCQGRLILSGEVEANLARSEFRLVQDQDSVQEAKKSCMSFQV